MTREGSTTVRALRSAVPDDRILGGSRGVVKESGWGGGAGTSDLHLQNKADAIGLPYAETPAKRGRRRATTNPQVRLRRRSDGGDLPLAELTNDGPVEATDVTFSISAPEGTTPRFTAGPWELARLDPGETVSNEMYGLFPQDIEASVTLVGSRR